MTAWFAANGGTILVVLVLLAVVARAIWKLRKDKKAGTSSSCGCGCEHCAMHDKCHQQSR